MTELIVLTIGYIASLLLAISLIVTNDLKFRWLNTLGCIAFIIYGCMIQALPVILTNGILAAINLFYLYRIYSTTENFDLLEMNPTDKLIDKFLSFYKTDVNAYFPGFTPGADNNTISFIVLRDLVIANIFIAKVTEEGNAIVTINYTVPKYRDYKVGKFIFDREKKYLLSKGVKQIIYTKVAHRQHQQFLKVMGFKQDPSARGGLIKVL